MALFRRIVDGRASSIVYEMFEGESRQRLLKRLGYLNCFFPEKADAQYRLDLSVRDEHCLAHALVLLAVKEKGENWSEEKLDGLEFELPSTWIKAVPHTGILEVGCCKDTSICLALMKAPSLLVLLCFRVHPQKAEHAGCP